MIDAQTAAEFVQIRWETIAAVVTPIALAAVGAVKLLITRADKDRDALLGQIKIGQDALTESVKAFKDLVTSTQSAAAASRSSMDSIVQTQQRLVYAQERILALLEADMKIASRREVEIGK